MPEHVWGKTEEVVRHLRIDRSTLDVLIYESDEAEIDPPWVTYGSSMRRPRRRWDMRRVDDWFHAVGHLRWRRERDRLHGARRKADLERPSSVPSRRRRRTNRQEAGESLVDLARRLTSERTSKSSDEDR